MDLQEPGAVGRDVGESVQLEARAGEPVDLIIRDVRFILGSRDGHGAADDPHLRVHVGEGNCLRHVDRGVHGLHGRSRIQGLLCVDAAARDHLALEDLELVHAAHEDLLDLLHAEGRPVHPDERGQAAGVGRGHGRAAEEGVPLVGDRGEDAAPGGGEVHRPLAVAGEGRELALDVGGGHGDDAVRGVARGVVRGLVVVAPGVARGGQEEDAGGLRALDGDAEGSAGTAAAPGVTHDLRSMGDAVLDRLDCIRGSAGACVAQELQGHQPDAAPSDPGDAQGVVANARDGPGAVRAVPLVVHGVAVLVDKVSPVHIIDKAVLVIVDAIARDLTRVHPHVLLQVVVRVIDARVDDGHDDASAGLAREGLPRLRGVDVGALVVVHGPEGGEVGVVGEALRGPRNLDHRERRLVVNHRPQGSQPAIWLGSNESAMDALQVNEAVTAVDQVEPLPTLDQASVCVDTSPRVHANVLVVVRPQGDGSVVVLVELELLLRTDLLAPGVDGAVCFRRDVLALERPEGDHVCCGRLSATGKHETVHGGAALADELQRRAARLRRALPQVRGLGGRGWRRGSVELDPRVRSRELDEGVLLQLPHEALLGIRGGAGDDGHARAPQRLHVQHARLGPELQDLLLQELGPPELRLAVCEADNDAVAAVWASSAPDRLG
mmetsp:Transcript_93197/g.287600  ORF Transcript_93197/g.287600 Transcript_93197/m.287600 type:complete len:664 (+) Transcript_93197:2148-4139(+)